MKIEVRESLPAPSSEAIKNLEAIIKMNLLQEYIDLLNGMNGAYIQGNIFDIPGGNNAGGKSIYLGQSDHHDFKI
ncbi:hypothetical protein ACRS8P_03355 [Burkholderia cenocepacia]